MPIQMTNRAPGMPAEAYDEIMRDVAEPLRRSEGFISHAAQLTDAGLTVTEVWETREQWERWFDSSVRPHLPPGAHAPTVVELHHVVGRQLRCPIGIGAPGASADPGGAAPRGLP